MDTTIADPLIGALLEGRYRIRGRIARGGMATVYHATDERLERAVAVKVVHPAQSHTDTFRGRFAREAKTIARLTHPNVVAVFDTGEHAGLPYLVMEYVRGHTLRDVLADGKKLPASQALAIAGPVLAALAAAHHAGLVHRDVKPENVLIGDDGTIKVADFGLARAVAASSEDSAEGHLMATVAYVAPELVTDGQADPRSDVYSAGVMLFEMLTGQVPHTGETAVEVAYQHADRDIPPPSELAPELPAAVDDLVVRATRRAPDARPDDAGAMLAELRAVRGDTGPAVTNLFRRGSAPVPARHTVVVPADDTDGPYPTSQQRTIRARRGSRPDFVLAAMLIALGLVAAFGGWWLGVGRYTEAPSMLNLTRQQAEAKAKQAGFDVAYEGEYRENVPRDIVVKQDPHPNGRIVRDGTITLTLSLGPERYQIPNVVGKTRAEALEELRKIKSNPKTQEAYSNSVPAGDVISVTPKPGTSVKPGEPVTVVVSKGQPPVTVPDVEDQYVEIARMLLEQRGLRVKVVKATSETVRKGWVISQNPKPQTGVEEGTEVTLTVSAGAPLVEVPDVVGKKAGEARRILEEAGFQVRHLDIPGGDNRVSQQNPRGGKHPKGSTVLIWSV